MSQTRIEMPCSLRSTYHVGDDRTGLSFDDAFDNVLDVVTTGSDHAALGCLGLAIRIAGEEDLHHVSEMSLPSVRELLTEYLVRASISSSGPMVKTAGRENCNFSLVIACKDMLKSNGVMLLGR